MTACPVCGDPNAFPIWIDDLPPPTCPHDPVWPERSVQGTCERQRRKAEQAAELRRLTPDAFDENGNVIAGQIGRAVENYLEAHPNKPMIFG